MKEVIYLLGLKRTYIFDSFGAEHFHKHFNDLIIEYGVVTVGDLFDDPLLLDHPEEIESITYFKYGWTSRIPATKMFKIRESKHGGMFEYVLNLPTAEAL